MIVNMVRVNQDYISQCFDCEFKTMWEQNSHSFSLQHKSGQPPLITYQGILVILISFLISHKLMEYLLTKYFRIEKIRTDPNLNAFESSPIFHLMILMLVLREVQWNMFDLQIWALIYMGVSILRKIIFNVRAQKDSLLTCSYSYDYKLMALLRKGRNLGLACFILEICISKGLHLIFWEANTKVISLLVFPLNMASADSIFLFLNSVASEKDILCSFNQNTNLILPTYKLQLFEKLILNSIRTWHLYTLLKIVFGNFLTRKMEFIGYIWIFSIFNECFKAVSIFYQSVDKYRNYNKLMSKFDRAFSRATSAPDQNCTICLVQLLNCRQLVRCGHLFHYKCLFQWLQNNIECPICRRPIFLN